MSTALVLRFGDFGYDTIEEHRAYISEPSIGYVWWGWWKKEGVDGSEEQELNQLRFPLKAGLFYRGKRSFYRSKIDEVCVNPDGTRLHSPEPQKTPSYYRGQKCAAWFKMTEIEEITRADFIQDFGPVFVGEQTLQIRKDVQVLAPTEREPYQAEGDTILHLSDLHFGKDYGYPETSTLGEKSLIERLTVDISELDKRIGLVIVSGDVLTACDANDYQYVENFIEQIAEILRLDIARQVVVVPGNHDIRLSEKKEEIVQQAVNFEHEWAFREFLKRLYRTECEIPRVERVNVGGILVEVMAMNSVRLRYKPFGDYGFVDWSLYENLLSPIDSSEPPNFRLAVLHHHLVSAYQVETPEEERRISVTVDAGEVIEGLQKLGFRLVLHGHQHVPKITKIARAIRTDLGGLEGLDRPIYTVASGSSGASRLPKIMPLNTYSLIDLSNQGMELLIRQYNSVRTPETYISTSLQWEL